MIKALIKKLKERLSNEKHYVVWNPEFSLSPEPMPTYGDLLRVEAKTGNSMSSGVVTSDIEGVIDAVHNEANIILKYHQINP